METLFYWSIVISAVSLLSAGVLKLYAFAYQRGYDHGKHCGFTEGLYRAAERVQRQAARQEYWVE